MRPPSEIRAHRHGQRRGCQCALANTASIARLNQRVRRVALGLPEHRHAPAYRRTARGDNRPGHPYQAINARPLPLFDATATFEAVMRVFHQTSMSIPLDPLGILVQASWWAPWVTKIPVLRLLATRRACSSQTRITYIVTGSLPARGACARWQERHLPTGKLELGRTRLATMPGGNLERTARQARACGSSELISSSALPNTSTRHDFPARTRKCVCVA